MLEAGGIAIVFDFVGAEDGGGVDLRGEALGAEHEGVAVGGGREIVRAVQDVGVKAFEPEGELGQVPALLDLEVMFSRGRAGQNKNRNRGDVITDQLTLASGGIFPGGRYLIVDARAVK